MTKPFFRADQVGSLLRPERLHKARTDLKKGLISAATLRQIEDACIADAVKFQESVGLQVITDGEFRRENWWIDFISQIGGVQIEIGDGPSFKRGNDHDFKYVPLNVVTVAKLARPRDITVADFKVLAGCTKRTPKITLPSPSRMHFHGGRKGVSNAAYPNMEGFFADIAALYRAEIAALEASGCRFIQIDDPLLTYFISDKMRDQVRADGEDPGARLKRYVQLINECIRDRRPDTRIGVHLCRGNSRSGWMTEGGYERIAETVFNTLAADSFYLEFDDARSGDFGPLRFVPKDKMVVLGLVTTKFPKLEDKSELKRRIDEASHYVGHARLALSPQCGFASSVEGNLITEDVQRAKLQLVVETAAEVWGNA